LAFVLPPLPCSCHNEHETFLEALLALTLNSDALREELHHSSEGFLAVTMMSMPESMRDPPSRRVLELALTIVAPIVQRTMFSNHFANPHLREKDTAAFKAWGEALASLFRGYLWQRLDINANDLQEAVSRLKVRLSGKWFLGRCYGGSLYTISPVVLATMS
jgi:hypothetical protein